MKVTYLSVAELSEAPFNVRDHQSEEVARRWASFKHLGFHHEFAIWANSAEHGYLPNVILGGHGRRLSVLYGFENDGLAAVKAVKNLRVKADAILVPCHLIECDELTAKRINISLNSHEAQNDFPRLKDVLVEVDVGDIPIEVTGYSEEEIVEMLKYGKGGREHELAQRGELEGEVGAGMMPYLLFYFEPDDEDYAPLAEYFNLASRKHQHDTAKLKELCPKLK